MEKKKLLSIIVICVVLPTLFLISTNFVNKESGGTGTYNDQTAQFIHEAPSRTLASLKAKKSGIYYFGFPSCPWCQELLPVFNTVLKKNKLKAYVVDTRSSTYTSKDNIVLEQFFIHYINKKRLVVPLIIMINQDGKIKNHIATVPGHNAEMKKMTSSQKRKLEVELNQMCIWYKN